MGLMTGSRVDLIDSSLQSSAVEIPWAVWPPEPACSRSDDLLLWVRSGIPVLGEAENPTGLAQSVTQEVSRLLL